MPVRPMALSRCARIASSTAGQGSRPPADVPATKACFLTPEGRRHERDCVAVDERLRPESSVTNTMLPGLRTSAALPVARVSMYARMKSIQIGSAAVRAGLAVAERLLLVVAHPHADGDVGVEADEPGVGVVVHRAGLAGERPVERRGRRRGAALRRRRAAGWSSRTPCRRGCARAARAGSPRAALPSRSVTDHDRVRLHAHALVRERGVGARHLEQRRFGGAERERQIRRVVAREAEALRRRRRPARGPSVVHHLDGRDVARLLERAPQRDRPLELAVVVVRLIRRLARAGLVATPARRRRSTPA